MAKDIQCEVRNIISEIEEKAADGNYIYRGESKHYCKVSSGLWRQFRQCRSTFASHDRADFDCRLLQTAYLTDARKHGEGHHQDDFELASELQHVGGNTNLIDFTKCHLVALFFACEKFYKKPGRVILLKQTEKIKNKYKIKEPQYSITNRVTAQKSVFVEHPSGVIEEDDIEEIICIRPSFKQPILTCLRKKHIYTPTIYNDLQGYIKHQQNHHDAYSEYGRGVLCYCYAANNRRGLKNNTGVRKAIKHFRKAIKFYPDFVEAHLWRANIYFWTEKFDKAIKGYTKVIELEPDNVDASFRRGQAYSKKGCLAHAEQDLIRAIELGEGFAHDLLLEVRARSNQ